MAVQRYGDFEGLRVAGRDIRDYAITHLDTLLETFEASVNARGGKVHWARNADEARQAVLDILRETGAKTVTKGKSMVTEEIALNPFLEANGIMPVETDLGEYIIQLRHEPPSHIIAPAFHLSKEQVADTFREAHTELDPKRSLDERNTLVQEARQVLRASSKAPMPASPAPISLAPPKARRSSSPTKAMAISRASFQKLTSSSPASRKSCPT